MTKIEAQIKQYGEALNRLNEVLALPKNDVVRDSAIQRFEFCLDLAWKSVKTFLEEKSGVICNSPKDCFREAYKQGLIQYDDDWLKLVDMRNETVHTYNQEMAELIYSQLAPSAVKFEILRKILNEKINYDSLV
jgi:nucleotidyltransferase substrate binding protein (TIGR01987 family)